MVDISAEDLVRFFAYRSEGHMASTRLHKLVYLSQLYSLDQSGRALNDLAFVSYKHGPWSVQLAEVIENFEAGDKDVLVTVNHSDQGMIRRIQPIARSPAFKWSDHEKKVLDGIWSDFGFVPTEIIIAICKSASLFRNTEFKEEVDFEGYARRRERALADLESASKGEKAVLPSLGFDWEVTKEDEGFSALNRDLPSCITQGETLEELEMNMREALLAFLDYRVKALETPA
jgi:predicted RNase H-like HicB family nuclease/uncharacterized phage-associated protein